jgi:hypothetical protein
MRAAVRAGVLPLFALVLGVAPSAVAGQAAPGELIGQLTDSAARPIGDARVIARPGERLTRTDADGRFRFAGLAPGTYVLELRKIGFLPVSRMVVVAGASPATVTVRMTPNVQMLAAVAVSAREARLPRVMERLRKEQGEVLFAEEIMRLGMFHASDLLRFTRLQRELGGVQSCASRRHYFVDGRPLPPEWEIDAYVRPEEIEAIETHKSADLVRESFLFPSSKGVYRGRTKQIGGGLVLGTPPPPMGSLKGTCARVIMVWTKFYRGQTEHP